MHGTCKLRLQAHQLGRQLLLLLLLLLLRLARRRLHA
jgi:hypothetical protein